MASIQKLELEVEIKCNPDKFWESIRSSETIFPVAFPETYKSVEIVEGDGKSVGSVRLLKYAEGVPMVTYSKEKLEEVDDAKKILTYSVVGGELLNYLKSFKATLAVVPKAGGGVAKWSSEFEKASDEVPDPESLKEFAAKTFHDLDAYLLQA